MDFETVISKFKARRELSDATQSTIDTYVRHVRSWRDWLRDCRGTTVWDADTSDMRVFIESRVGDGVAPTTINQRVAAVSQFYQDCHRIAEDYDDAPDVPTNPYEELGDDTKAHLRGDTKKKQGLQDSGTDEYPYLKKEKVEQLIDNVPAPKFRNRLILQLLFNCGLRRGELAKMKIDHINLDDRSILIPPRKSPEQRQVPFDESYVGFPLRRWLNHGERDRMTQAPESEYLLPTNRNKHMSGQRINEVVKSAAEAAGLQETINKYSDGREIHKVTAHTLRHSYAMRALDSGIDVRTLQSLLGHEELDTTMIYLQQSTEEAKEKGRAFRPTD